MLDPIPNASPANKVLSNDPHVSKSLNRLPELNFVAYIEKLRIKIEYMRRNVIETHPILNSFNISLSKEFSIIIDGICRFKNFFATNEQFL